MDTTCGYTGDTTELEKPPLNYKSINFTDEQYEEALKRVSSPTDANQLLVALMDVSCNDTTVNKQAHNTNNNDNESDQRLRNNCADECTTNSSSSSAFSSCRSSVRRLLSNDSDQCSLKSLEQTDLMQHHDTNQTDHLRPIFIDGSNVARTHGKDAIFSWPGIKYCVDWFYSRNHNVKVLVPEDKCQVQAQSEDEFIINYLTHQIGALVKTPTGHNDDLFIIEAARLIDGIIVSNDQFRDETKRSRLGSSEDHQAEQQFVYLNRLPYIFVDDLFIPAKDPRGKSGPRLDEFLRKASSSSEAKSAIVGLSIGDNRRQTRWRRSGGASQYQPSNARQQSEYNHHLYLKNRARTLPAEQMMRRPDNSNNNNNNNSINITNHHHPQVQSANFGPLISIGRTKFRSRNLAPQAQQQQQQQQQQSTQYNHRP